MSAEVPVAVTQVETGTKPKRSFGEDLAQQMTAAGSKLRQGWFMAANYVAFSAINIADIVHRPQAASDNLPPGFQQLIETAQQEGVKAAWDSLPLPAKHVVLATAGGVGATLVVGGYLMSHRKNQAPVVGGDGGIDSILPQDPTQIDEGISDRNRAARAGQENSSYRRIAKTQPKKNIQELTKPQPQR
ncbi:MAG: hypothetical protein AAB874_06730 [Patescibacteria group bacterium]